LRSSEILVTRQWKSEQTQRSIVSGHFPSAFAALAQLQDPNLNYHKYHRETLSSLPLQAMMEPNYNLDLMSAGATNVQFKLLQLLDKKLGRPNTLVTDDPMGAKSVAALLVDLVGDRPATRDDLVLREKMREILRRVALVKRSPTPPSIDGELDDACWSHAAELGHFFRLSTIDPSTFRTEARFAYDSKRLYVSFIAYQDKGSLWRESGGTRDGRVWCDDAVELFINRVEAKDKHYAQFIINAWGDIFDVYNGDTKFDAKLECSTQIHDDRFVIEAAIPWTDLPGMSPKDRVLRMNLQRGKWEQASYVEVSNGFPGAEGPGNLDARGRMVLLP